MTTRVALHEMTDNDQDQIRAWSQDWGPLIQAVFRPSPDEYRDLVPAEKRERRIPMFATIFQTIDGIQVIGPDGLAVTFDVEVPEMWEARFPVILGPGAGIVAAHVDPTKIQYLPKENRIGGTDE